jgi:hypothetical protein
MPARPHPLVGLIPTHDNWALHLTGVGDFAPWPIWRRPIQGWRVPAFIRWGWGHGLGVSGRDEIPIPHRPVNNSQIQNPIEQHSAAPGVATVEAEHELVQGAGQVRSVHGSLVSAQQPSLAKGGDPVNAWQKFARILIERRGRPARAASAGPLARGCCHRFGAPPQQRRDTEAHCARYFVYLGTLRWQQTCYHSVLIGLSVSGHVRVLAPP